jgi:hypothetical protein
MKRRLIILFKRFSYFMASEDQYAIIGCLDHLVSEGYLAIAGVFVAHRKPLAGVFVGLSSLADIARASRFVSVPASYTCSLAIFRVLPP